MTDLVQAEWRNYAMCAAYGQTQGAASQTIQVCFNPFLETSTGIPDGQAVCADRSPIDFDNDPMYAPFTRTDFSWAVPVNAL